MRDEIRGITAAVLSSCLGGTAVVVTRQLVPLLDPLTLAVLRYGCGSLCLGVVLLWRRQPLGSTDRLEVILLGALFFAGFPALFNLALAWTTAARGALSLATLPLLTLLLAAALGSEALTARKLAGVGLAMAGVALALGADLGQAPPGAWRGDLVMLAAAGCGAGYNVAVRPLLCRHPPLAFITRAMGAGVALLGPTAALAGTPARLWGLDAAGWSAILYLGVVGGAVVFWLWTYALEHTTPTRVAVTVALNPVVAIALAALWLQEAPSLGLLAGAGTVLAGILLTAWPGGGAGAEAAVPQPERRMQRRGPRTNPSLSRPRAPPPPAKRRPRPATGR